MGKKSEKRTRNVVSSDEDDAPNPKSQRNENKDDEFDNLFDDDEREKLNQMSEKDRETEIFKRIEMNLILKTREEIKKKLEMTQKSEKKTGAPSTSANADRPKKVDSDSGSSSSDNDDDDDDKSSSDSASDDGELSDADAANDKSDEEEEEGEISVRKNAKTSRKTATKPATNKSKRVARNDSDEESSSSGSESSSDDDDDDDEDFDTEFHRPSELHEKNSKKKAMDVLLSKRRDKKEAEEKRKQKTAALDIDEIFGDDKQNANKTGSSSSSSSSRSSSTASSRDASPEPKPEITTIEELKRCRISRFRLAQNVHSPFFKQLAVGCFVRIGVGGALDGMPYRISQIVDVVETAKVYDVEKTRTNKGLRLKHGADERVYRLEFVSNTEFNQSEFQHWMNAMKAKNIPLPTLDFVEKKQAEIQRYNNYTLTNADVDYIVKEKMKFSRGPSNFAVRKGELMKLKEYAEQSGNFLQVQELQRKIDELDTRADQLDRQRSQKLSVVTWINQRNRDHMKQSFLGANVAQHVGIKSEDDPFTRKSSKMRVVSGKRVSTSTATIAAAAAAAAVGDASATTINAININAAGLGVPEGIGVGGSLSRLDTTKTVAASALGGAAAGDALFKPPYGTTGRSANIGGVMLPSANDLFSAHDIDIDIHISLPAASSTLRASAASGGASSSSDARAGGASAQRPGGARALSIEEYKRKRGLI